MTTASPAAAADPTDTKPVLPAAALTRREKRWRRGLPWSEAVTDAFPAFADIVDRARRKAAHRYDRFSRWHMAWFRVGGFLEIVLSVSFPFVITLLSGDPTQTQLPEEIRRNELIITSISVAIALVGGIRAFYGWNDNWRLYKTQQLALTGIVQRWELELMALVPDPQRNMLAAHEATRQAIEDIAMALEHEQDTFFGSVRLPEELTRKSGPPKSEPASPPPA